MKSFKWYVHSNLQKKGKGCTHSENQGLIWEKTVRCANSHGPLPTTDYLTLISLLLLWVKRPFSQCIVLPGSASSHLSKKEVCYMDSHLHGIKVPL